MLLPPGRYDNDILVLKNYLRFASKAPLGQAADAGTTAANADDSATAATADDDAASTTDAASPASPDLLWLEPNDVIRFFGETEARQRYLWQAHAALETDPHRALALILRLWSTLEGAGHARWRPVRRAAIGVVLISERPALAVRCVRE
jgi:hypothetical protein